MMDIAKQIIDQRINGIIEKYSQNHEYAQYFRKDEIERNRSKAFLLLGVSVYLDIDLSEAVQYITDGGGDGGFDAVYIEPIQDSILQVTLFQAKYVRDLSRNKEFATNDIEKAVNTARYVFDPRRTLSLNAISKAYVDEITSYLLEGRIPQVKFVMLNNGGKWNQDGQAHIDHAFADNDQMAFEHFNHQSIIDKIQKPKDTDVRLRFSGKAIREDFNYKSVLLGRVSILEIGRLLEERGDVLLEANIRKYLGSNLINRKMRETLLDDEDKQNFFFFNNGITMICDRFKFNALQETNWIVTIEGLQIINGGQTCKTLQQVLQENPEVDFNQVYVLVKLYEISADDDVVSRIILANNSQNPVELRDLKANDRYQRDLELGAADLGITYKRKRDNLGRDPQAIPSAVAAEAVLAIWRKKPHLARHKKAEFFDQYYEEIFAELNASQMIIAVIVFRFCDHYRRKLDTTFEAMTQRPYSQYFIAYLIGQLLLRKHHLRIENLTHKNFAEVKKYFETHKEELYQLCQNKLIDIIKEHFSKDLESVNGRTMSALFRRFDLVETYFKDENWWSSWLIQGDIKRLGEDQKW